MTDRYINKLICAQINLLRLRYTILQLNSSEINAHTSNISLDHIVVVFVVGSQQVQSEKG